MSNQNLTVTFTVEQTPEVAFAAINKVGEWWTGSPGVEGTAQELGDEFTYRYEDLHYSKQKVVEQIPGKRVVWLVEDSLLTFVQDKHEWTGTTITFEIVGNGNETEVRFTHFGLVPKCECFSGCSDAWSYYVCDSLKSLIQTGKGA